jgi:hypothetical protein
LDVRQNTPPIVTTPAPTPTEVTPGFAAPLGAVSQTMPPATATAAPAPTRIVAVFPVDRASAMPWVPAGVHGPVGQYVRVAES